MEMDRAGRDVFLYLDRLRPVMLHPYLELPWKPVYWEQMANSPEFLVPKGSSLVTSL